MTPDTAGALADADGADTDAGTLQRSRWARLVGRLPGRRLWAYLAIAGPGLIAANAGNDAAGIATYATAGSQFVYRTLFFMVLVTVALVLVQEMAVRLGTYTGKGLAALIRDSSVFASPGSRWSASCWRTPAWSCRSSLGSVRPSNSSGCPGTT